MQRCVYCDPVVLTGRSLFVVVDILDFAAAELAQVKHDVCTRLSSVVMIYLTATSIEETAQLCMVAELRLSKKLVK